MSEDGMGYPTLPPPPHGSGRRTGAVPCPGCVSGGPTTVPQDRNPPTLPGTDPNRARGAVDPWGQLKLTLRLNPRDVEVGWTLIDAGIFRPTVAAFTIRSTSNGPTNCRASFRDSTWNWKSCSSADSRLWCIYLHGKPTDLVWVRKNRCSCEQYL